MTVTDVNASQLRLYYLQQLGIAAYVPRGASAAEAAVDAKNAVEAMVAAAVVAEQQHDVQTAALHAVDSSIDIADTADTSAATGAVISGPRPAPIRRMLLEPETSPPPAAPVRAAAAATTTAAEAEADTTPPFQLLLAVIDTELAVAIQIPAQATSGLREQEQKLLQNLLRWLGYPLPDMKALLQYRWPLPGLPANSAAMATRTLTVFLQQAASTRPFRHLLLLGPLPAQCLHDQPAAWTLWPTHSVAELLTLPQLKRDSWLQLQPLQRELQQKHD